MSDKTLEEFKKAIDDIYQQGYICGFGADSARWIEIYAKVLVEISKGEEFGDKLIFACDDSIPTNMNMLN